MKQMKRKDELKSGAGIRFRTLHVVDGCNKEVSKIIVASRRRGCDSEGAVLYHVQFAYCSPQDSYNRAKGRLIAARRMDNPKSSIQLIIGKNDDFLFKLKGLVIKTARDKEILWIAGANSDNLK